MLRVVDAYGSPYERGFRYGRAAGDLIKRNASFFLSLWSRTLGLSREAALSKALEFAEAVNSLYPDLYEEMRGMADGASISLSLVAAVNSRYEFMRLSLFGGGCTSLTILPEASVDQHIIAGQNWDYHPGVAGSTVILRLRTRRLDILSHVEAGALARTGLNSSGLGLAVNALASGLDRFGRAVPFLVLCRLILESKNMDDVVEEVSSLRTRYPGRYSYNFLVASASGDAASLEVHPRGINVVRPIKGVLVHTNHFLGDTGFEDLVPRTYPDTLIRYRRVWELLSGEAIGVNDVKTVFRDHYNFPRSICRHLDPGASIEHQSVTIASIIMDLNRRLILVTKGQPCINDYRPFSINGSRATQTPSARDA